MFDNKISGRVIFGNPVFDSTRKIHSLFICGAEFLIRVPDPSQTKQILEPGICVIAPIETIGSNLAEEICNQDPDLQYAPYSNIEEKLLASMISGYDSIEYTQFSDPKGYYETSVDVYSVFNSCSDKPSALSHCGQLLLSTQKRKCLTNIVQANIFPVFLDCLKASCKSVANACANVKASKTFQDCHPEALKCDTW